ncbi:hypothetical protein ABIF65_010840 [Bradyrhizobium japonicum]|jgi:hypothetical protein
MLKDLIAKAENEGFKLAPFVGALGQNAFEALALRLGEEFLSAAFAMLAECDQLVTRQDGLEPLLAFK